MGPKSLRSRCRSLPSICSNQRNKRANYVANINGFSTRWIHVILWSFSSSLNRNSHHLNFAQLQNPEHYQGTMSCSPACKTAQLETMHRSRHSSWFMISEFLHLNDLHSSGLGMVGMNLVNGSVVTLVTTGLVNLKENQTPLRCMLTFSITLPRVTPTRRPLNTDTIAIKVYNCCRDIETGCSYDIKLELDVHEYSRSMVSGSGATKESLG